MAVVAAQLEVQFKSSGSEKVKGELKGLDDALQSAGSGFDQFYKQIGGFADRALDSLTKVADGIGKISLVGVTAIFGKGAKAAWDQVDAVEQATIALRAYEKDARKVDKVLEDLLQFARSDAGKLFMREELFRAAQTMKVAGAETENLARYVEIMSRAVNTGMASWDDLERVIARVGSTGRLTGIEFELLQQAGFQLDESLRNTTITWEQLFDALDRGSVQVEGQSETIRGRLMSLNSAIRDIGTAFLAVDRDTSEFIEGGLGSRLVGGIDLAIAALGRIRPAAAAAGSAFALVLDGAEGLMTAFQALPGAAQTIVVGLLGAVAAFGMLRQAIAAMSSAMRLMGLGSFTALFTPLGAAIAGVALVGGLLVNSFMDQKAAAEAYKQSVIDLEQALEMLRRKGDTELADLGTNLMNQVNDLQNIMDGFLRDLDDDAFYAEKFAEQMGHAFDPNNMFDVQMMAKIRQQYSDEFNSLVGDLQITQEEITALNMKMLDALNDPNINAEAWMTWAMSLLTGAENAEELRAAVDLIIETPLSDWARHAVDDLDNLNAALDRTDQSWRDWQEGMGPFDAPAEVNVVEWEDFVKQVEDGIAESRDRIREGMNEMMTDWLADGDNFLDWWQEFDAVLIDHYGGVQDAGAAWRSFRENVIPTAAAIDDANASFDQVLRTFEQIDQLAKRPQGAASIAESLVGAPGEWAAIDDLLESGRISLAQYNQTVESGYAITESAARSQMILNEIRADQLPLLEAETRAYEQNLEAIAALEPAEQRRVLMLQDTAVQAQVAELYSTAYAASLGQIPPEVATQMILNAAEADAGLKDLLLNLGLISEVDGEIRVNFPDADKTIQAIDRVTHSVLLLMDLMDDGEINGSIKLTIEGDEELKETYGFLLEVDETDVEATATVEANADPAKVVFEQIISQLRGLDGQSAKVYQYGDNSDAIANIDDVAADLADLDGSTATVYINAVNNAGAAIGSVASQLANLDGQSATVSVNTVNTTTYRAVGSNRLSAYADGGFVRSQFQLVGEEGPELVQLPRGSYVHTAQETAQMLAHRDGGYGFGGSTSSWQAGGTTYHGDTVEVHIHGNVIGNDDFASELTERVVWELATVKQRRDLAKGVAI